MKNYYFHFITNDINKRGYMIDFFSAQKFEKTKSLPDYWKKCFSESPTKIRKLAKGLRLEYLGKDSLYIFYPDNKGEIIFFKA